MSTQYTIKIEKFEGPFDLLFHLIEKNKIDIYDIPIAVITEQYLEYLQAMQEMDLEIASEFLVMAATLLHIKSRMLLPKHKEEALQEDDPREELVSKLLEYKKYKEFAEELKERERMGNMLYYKIPEVFDFEPPSQCLVGLNPEVLRDAFKKILEAEEKEEKHKRETFSQILNREKVSVAKKVRDITKILKDNEKINFSSLFEESSSKIEKIAVFLAVLELIKLKKIIVEQVKNYGEIVLYKNEGDFDEA